jgi:hypothetical protein
MEERQLWIENGLLREQVVCLITEKREHTDHFPFSYIFLFILKRANRTN